MALAFNCQYCGKTNQVEMLKRGEFALCVHCGKPVVIPDNAQEVISVSYTPPPPRQVNPYTHIWLHPRETIRQVIDQQRFMEALLIVVVSGILNSIFSSALDSSALGAAFAMAGSAFGFIFGAIAFFIIGGVYWLAGKGMGSKSDIKDILIALGWASIPGLLTSVLVPLLLHSRFQEIVATGTIDNSFLMLALLLIIPVAIYAIVLLVIALSEAYRFTIGRTIVTLLLIIATFIAIAIILAVACFALFSGLKTAAPH